MKDLILPKNLGLQDLKDAALIAYLRLLFKAASQRKDSVTFMGEKKDVGHGFIYLEDADVTIMLRLKNDYKLIDYHHQKGRGWYVEILNWREICPSDIRGAMADVEPLEVLHQRKDTKMWLTKVFHQQLLQRQPGNLTLQRATVKSWYDPIRLMIDIDKRDPREIYKIMRWCIDHHFWKDNILSTSKLRQQYDKLMIQMESESKPAAPTKARAAKKIF